MQQPESEEDDCHGLATAAPCRELVEAWALLEEELSDDEFFEKLILLLPSMLKNYVHMAWVQWQHMKFSISSGNVAKRKLQVFVYVALFSLMMATAGEDGACGEYYKGEEEVSSSIIFKRPSEEDKSRWVKHMATIKPDAAVTLAPGLDPFTMLLIHTVYPYDEHAYTADKDKPYIIHDDKSPLMTKFTAEVIRPCIPDPDQYVEVALPFIVITGQLCSLYVTTLDRHGESRIQVVGYPHGGNGRNNDLSKASSVARKEFFLAFAVLLNKFRSFFEANCREQYESMLRERMCRERLYDLPKFFLSGKNNEKINEIDGSLEKAAQEAAACNGMFTDVTYPFERLYLFTDDGIGDQMQHTSPYYFTGCPTSKGSDVPTKVFLKVWKPTDRCFQDVESERMHHQRAFDAGIPVAAPTLDKIVRSKSSCGTEHFVFVTEYLDEDTVETVRDVLQYSVSLMQTVLQLHTKVGMLHCSLKPDNVRWNKGVIKLIDFEMAQTILDARWKPGPVGFMAPEVLKKLPCSTKTDAFSVGKTILAKLDRLSNNTKDSETQVCKILHDVAAKLTDDDTNERWTLEQALGQLEDRTMQLVPRVWKKRSAESALGRDRKK